SAFLPHRDLPLVTCSMRFRNDVFTQPRPEADLGSSRFIALWLTFAPRGRLSSSPPVQFVGCGDAEIRFLCLKNDHARYRGSAPVNEYHCCQIVWTSGTKDPSV